MENFTIHVFGYGETQINSKDLSVKVPTDTLTTVTPLLAGVFAKKPTDNTTLETDFHAVNFFGYNDVRWMSKEGFNLKDEADFKTLIDNLIAELQNAKDNQQIVTPPAPNMDAPKS
jgi:hypothetical protein